MADRYRTTPQGRIIALLDGRVEGVHIDVDDLAYARFAHGENNLTSNERWTRAAVRIKRKFSASFCSLGKPDHMDLAAFSGWS
jgi:hypothetical protein